MYDGYGREIAGLIRSKDPNERQVGQAFALLEYENLHAAVQVALASQVSYFNTYDALSVYLLGSQDFARHLALSRDIYGYRDRYPAETLAGEVGLHFARTLEDIARCHLELKQLPAAGKAYRQELTDLDTITDEDWRSTVNKWKATAYHNLGRVAQEQRQWPQAEQYYQQALAIYIEFNDRYSQASTCHQLGMVAQAQRQWAQAREYFLQALQIGVEFQDKYRIATRTQSLARLWRESGDAGLP